MRQADEEAIPATRVIGVPIANLDYEQVLGRFARWVARGEHRYVCVCPVHSLIDSLRVAGHRRALLESDLNTADGMPVVWAQKLLGHRGASRVYGPNLMLKCLEAAEREGWRVAFYGGHPDRLKTMTSLMLERFPKLKVAAAISPPRISGGSEIEPIVTITPSTAATMPSPGKLSAIVVRACAT